MPLAPVVKVLSDLVVDSDFTFGKPHLMQDGSRFSTCRGPYVQTGELLVTMNDGNATLLCSEAYADVVAQLEEHAIDSLATNSAKWFGKDLTHEEVEHLMKSSIKGHRVPKHVLPSKNVRCYDHSLQLVETAPTAPSHCVCIVQIEGIKLDEKRAELCFKLQQMKYAEVPLEEPESAELSGPAFV